MSIISFTDTQIYLLLTGVILCSSKLIYFNLLLLVIFSSHFLHLSYSQWYIEVVLAILVLNSLFRYHVSNELESWINLYSSWYQWHIKIYTSHKHAPSSTGWKRGCCISGEMSPGKCFSLQKSPAYHHDLRLLCWCREDVISLYNGQYLGLLLYFVMWKLISL